MIVILPVQNKIKQCYNGVKDGGGMSVQGNWRSICSWTHTQVIVRNKTALIAK